MISCGPTKKPCAVNAACLRPLNLITLLRATSRLFKIRRYVRYMDDILILHEDKRQLKAWQGVLTHFLYEHLHLTINPRKVRIYPARQGVDFVGYVIYPRYKTLRGASVRRFKKRYFKQLKLMADSQIKPSQVEQSLDAWKAHASHAKTFHLQREMDALYDDHMFAREVQQYNRKQQKEQKPEPTQVSLFDNL